MKSKHLIAIAVASTFGWSAGAFAESGHEVVTPFSVSESGENIPTHQQGFGSSEPLDRIDQMALGSTSHEAGGTLSGSVSSGAFDSSDHYSAFGSESFGGMDDGLALADDGTYSDYYLVSWTPMSVESWDVYMIQPDSSMSGSDELAASEEIYFLTPSYDVVWFPTYELTALSDESGEDISG